MENESCYICKKIILDDEKKWKRVCGCETYYVCESCDIKSYVNLILD